MVSLTTKEREAYKALSEELDWIPEKSLFQGRKSIYRILNNRGITNYVGFALQRKGLLRKVKVPRGNEPALWELKSLTHPAQGEEFTHSESMESKQRFINQEGLDNVIGLLEQAGRIGEKLPDLLGCLRGVSKHHGLFRSLLEKPREELEEIKTTLDRILENYELCTEFLTPGSALLSEEEVEQATNLLKESAPTNSEPKEEELLPKEKAWDPKLFRRIESLWLSIRTNDCLVAADIHYVGELAQKTEIDLLRLKNFGRKTLDEVNSKLADLNLSLGMRLEEFPSREELDHMTETRNG